MARSAYHVAPWLSVNNATGAVNFYKSAFGAVEVERIEEEPGIIVIAQLLIGDTTVWVQQDRESSPDALGGRLPVRMILNVDDPDAAFGRALASGATEVASVHEDHGWRVGRLADPFGHHWEIAKRLNG